MESNEDLVKAKQVLFSSEICPQAQTVIFHYIILRRKFIYKYVAIKFIGYHYFSIP